MKGRSPGEEAAPELVGSGMILDPVSALRQRTSVVPITRADVAASVALVPRQVRDGFGMPYGFQRTNQSSRLYERERWYLSVSPGTVRVHSKTMAPKLSLWDDDAMTTTDAPVRGRVKEFSAKSRARMFSTLPSLDYGPMFATGNPSAMVTLTLPGRGWEELVPDVRTFKKMLHTFQREYKRAWGAMPVAVWKMEFQRRGAPHVHLFMVPPSGLARGRGVARTFPNWLSITWAKIVGAPLGSQARIDHELAGTGIDYVEGQRFSDPRRIAAYFSKHGVYADKEYQNWMPDHWRQAIIEGRSGGGHFWGYWQLEKAVETVELRAGRPARVIDGEPVMRHHARFPSQVDDASYLNNPHYVRPDLDDRGVVPADVVVVMRHLRRLARSRSFVKQVTVERWSVDGQTGVVKVRKRKVRRRTKYLQGQRAGFLVVNDGPSTARDIARLLGAEIDRSGFELVA